MYIYIYRCVGIRAALFKFLSAWGYLFWGARVYCATARAEKSVSRRIRRAGSRRFVSAPSNALLSSFKFFARLICVFTFSDEL